MFVKEMAIGLITHSGLNVLEDKTGNSWTYDNKPKISISSLFYTNMICNLAECQCPRATYVLKFN